MQVSLAHWNQDEAWGGFGGPHCMVKGGYSSLMEPVAATLNIRMGIVVSQISYNNQGVKVTSASGEHTCDVCWRVGRPDTTVYCNMNTPINHPVL